MKRPGNKRGQLSRVLPFGMKLREINIYVCDKKKNTRYIDWHRVRPQSLLFYFATIQTLFPHHGEVAENPLSSAHRNAVCVSINITQAVLKYAVPGSRRAGWKHWVWSDRGSCGLKESGFPARGWRGSAVLIWAAHTNSAWDVPRSPEPLVTPSMFLPRLYYQKTLFKYLRWAV